MHHAWPVARGKAGLFTARQELTSPGEVPKRWPLPKGNLGADVLINDIWGVLPEKDFFLVPGATCIPWSGPCPGSGSHAHGVVQLLVPAVLGAGGCSPEGHEYPWMPSEV